MVHDSRVTWFSSSSSFYLTRNAGPRAVSSCCCCCCCKYGSSLHVRFKYRQTSASWISFGVGAGSKIGNCVPAAGLWTIYVLVFLRSHFSHFNEPPAQKKMGVEGETKGGGSPFFAPTGEIPAEPKQSLNFVSAFSAYFIASKSAALEAKAFSRPIFVDSFFAYQTERFSCHKYIFIATYSIPET